MKGLVSFLKYNNAIPIAVSFVLLGSASAFAATNPEVIVDKQETVVSIDNTYIAEKNLKKYSPAIKILTVREDADLYYIDYEFTTILLQDHVWQDVTLTETMEVAKKSLGGNRDLGVFVTKQLSEKIDAELKRLKETQVFEKKKISSKKVATKYSGLVGGFLDDKTETIAKYKPVVKPPKPEPEVQTFARPDPNAKPKVVPKPPVEKPVVEPADEDEEDTTQTGTSTEETTEESDNERPEIDILGDNPARVALGGTYVDLGVVITDDVDHNLSARLFLNDVEVQSITIDTSTTGTSIIEYYVEDSGGKLNNAFREVVVYDPADEENTNGGGGSTGGGGATEPPEETPTTTPPVTSTTTPPVDTATTSDPEPPVTEDEEAHTEDETDTTETPDDTSTTSQQTSSPPNVEPEPESELEQTTTVQPQNQQNASSTGQ